MCMHMDYSNIRALLDKYWEGETSLEEEARLKQFFAAAPEGLPQDLQEAAPLFQYFDLATPQFELPAAELQAHLEQAPAETPVIKMGFLRNWMQYAAMLAIALGIGYGIQRHMDAGDNAGTPPATVANTSFRQDGADRVPIGEQEAYAETKKALLLLSKNLNKGKQEMAKLNVINEATDKVKAN